MLSRWRHEDEEDSGSLRRRGVERGVQLTGRTQMTASLGEECAASRAGGSPSAGRSGKLRKSG